MTNFKFVMILLYILAGSFHVQCHLNPEEIFQRLVDLSLLEDTTHTKKALFGEPSYFDDNKCRQQLLQVYDGLRNSERWSLEAVDAWGKIPSGIFSGNIFELGNYDQCLNVYHDPKTTGKEIINGQYCLASIKITGNATKEIPAKMMNGSDLIPNYGKVPLNVSSMFDNFVFSLGTCIPNQCSIEFISKLMEGLLETPSIEFSQKLCYQKKPIVFSAMDIFAICIFSFFGLLMACSTIYDLTMQYKRKPRNLNLAAFSIYTNGEKLFQCTKSRSVNILDCLNGIRSLSIIWIVFGHSHMFKMMMPNINSIEVTDYFVKISSTFVLAAPIAVDSFFLLSGILVTWTTMQKLEIISGKKSLLSHILWMYIHRYIRLTPAFAAGILFLSTLANHIANGPMYHMLEMGGDCSTHWWSALLYIQNYVNQSALCFGHSWYLSTDMQLFVLSPLVIYPIWRWRNKAIWLIPLLALVSVICNFMIFFNNEFTMKNTDPKQQERMEKTYYPIYTRMGVYVIGIGLGYILHHMKNNNVHIKKWIQWICWPVSFGSIFGVILGIYPLYVESENLKILDNSFYAALSRVGWGLALSWIIFACVRGIGGPINWFLSLPQWQPISRLSYSIYLVHYPIQVIMYASTRTPAYFNEINIVHWFWGDFGFSVTVAIFWTLAFESPILILEKLIRTNRTTDRTKKSETPNLTVVNVPRA